MAIGDDFTIDYTNKRLHHSSGSTVYTVNDLYSWLMDTFDESVQMDDKVPMSAQTPTAYTMINSWWLDIGAVSVAHKYLSGGAIKSLGYDASTYADGVRLLKFGGTYTNAVVGDIGREVGYSAGAPADTGTLIGYDNTLKYWWVRVDDTGDTFANTGTAIDLDDAAGTGTGILDAASTTGEELFANVYTLGTIESVPAPQIYVFQAGSPIAEWSSLTNWDRGHVDVLIQVKEAGVEIDSGVITVYARQAGDLFDNYEIDLTAGGRNAVPLGTADDLNEDTGDYYLLVDVETAGFTTVGQILTGGTSGATAEMVSYTDWGTEGVFVIRGVKGTFQDGETITGATEGSATTNGTVGDTYLAYDTETVGFTTLAQIVTGVTSGAKRLLRGIQDDGTTGKMVLQVDTTVTGSSRDAYYKDYSAAEVFTGATEGSASVTALSTTVISGWSDITVAFVNGTATHGGTTGTFTPGERVTFTGGAAIVLYDSGSAVTLGNSTITAINALVITGDLSGATCTASQNLQSAHTMNKNFSQQSAYPYDAIIEAGSIYEAARTLANVYEYLKFLTQEDSSFDMYTVVASVITILDGEEYIQAYTGYTPVKAAPFGTFAGGKLFGAQGIWIQGMAADQSYQFIDSNGVTREPYTSITVAITSLVSGDRVAVFRTSVGDIDKAIYSSHATLNVPGDTAFEVTADIVADTPSAGVLRVVDVSLSEEQRYRFASWTGKIFTLVTGATGTATVGSTGQTLIDSAADFGGADDVEVGDVIRNTTTAEYGIVLSVDSTTQLTTEGLASGWANTNAYDTNELDRTYVAADTAYAPFLDGEATGTSMSDTVLYSADRSVLIRVRKKGIIPFETTGTVGTAGLTVAAIRTTDSIVT